ncbi:TIGR03773 family transporter-associated surface protein [Solirubrobacter sp. CPCC 204708]|uniref:TIGR03773 family transporter-associated surface protein n=1 Tax=Solirubrobacter deserti TaxID=2282478 RepID=A0ABT4RP60_9ACTN|nr:TIGR03773 family transporter-associated surface protein [Solirubrobacter deserti]MBE2315755.1 TIGR03773 family transporter-associated surface protein [Solirubrobacter deserti]MDA0140355.1 TIGR03773 family transporter-associated surface protein [Solirubrobacter deserti]
MRVVLIPIALAGALLAPGPARAQVLSDGHVDYAARIVDGQFRSQIKDGTRGTTVWRDVPAVTFAVLDAARTTVPSSPSFAFLGTPGSAVWMLPQTQRAGLLWPGWNTEELSNAQVDGAVSWRLDSVDGPGSVSVFQSGTFGNPEIVFRSNDGLPDTYSIPLGTHAHANWAFSREGAYRLTFTMSARLSGGQTASDTQTLAVTVGTATNPTPTPTPDPGAPGGPSPTATPTPGIPGAPDTPATGDTTSAPALRPLSARLSGRTLRLRVRLDRRAKVAVTLRRSGRTTAHAKTRTVSPGTRTLKLRLNKRPKAGRHIVRITATTEGRSRTRTIALRVRN